MIKPLRAEELVEIGGETLRLALDFGALDAIEGQAGEPFDVIQRKLVSARKVPQSLQAKVLWGLLRRHHPDLTLDHAAAMVFDKASVVIGVAIGRLIDAAFFADKDDAEGKPNPPMPSGASEPS